MIELILFRAFQGLGAGAMMPISQAIIGDIFPPTQRAKWTGVLMSVFAVATIIGPLIGGWITDSSLGWRWTFYVNVPIGILALTFAAFALPGHVSLRKHRIDYVGSAFLVAAAVPLLLGLSWGGNTYPWLSWEIVGMFVFSVAMWVAFYLRERRAAEPVINPRLFQNSVFTRLGRGRRPADRRRCSAPSCSCRSSCRACSASRRPTPASSSCRS